MIECDERQFENKVLSVWIYLNRKLENVSVN